MYYQTLIGLFEIALLADFVELGRRNVAISKTVTSSSIFPNEAWNNLGNIVDGNLDQGGDKCRCCAATDNSNNPWITVDLEDEYWINEVILYGRTDALHEYQNFLGLELYLTQAYQINENSTYAYKVEGSEFINFANISFEEQALTRYLTIYMPKDSRILSMCEVEIFSSVCRPGRFGDDCVSACGQCHGNKPCDPITGDCEKCRAGFNGSRCLSVCDDGFYGSSCSGMCGYCFNGEPCDKINGTCEFCSPGYHGRLCDTECKPGTFGQNCSEECGICAEYSRCDHLTGFCLDGCAAGRMGIFCKQECETNTFGENCSFTCHCQDGISCNALTGSCENDACADGYLGIGCQQTSFEKRQEESGIPIAIFTGVTVALICIIIGLVAIVILIKCRNNQAGAQQGEPRRTETHTYDDLKF